MNPSFQSLVLEAAQGRIATFKDISQYTPADIREAIQLLVSEDKIDMAQALADAGISLYPESEDILAIAGLLAITRGDWPLAIELLKDLCTIQKENVQPMTYQMLARSLWCNLDLSEARDMIAQGLRAWPGNETLLSEQFEMTTAENVMPASPQLN